MNKTRIFGLFVAAALVIAIALVALGSNAAPTAQGAGVSPAGFGNVQQNNAQLISLASSGQINARLSPGMGDLRRYESLQVGHYGDPSPWVH